MRKCLAGFLLSACLAWEIFKFDVRKIYYTTMEDYYGINLLVRD